MKLFCLPYAGKSAMMYNAWKRQLDETIQVIPVELSGRGRRWREPFYSHLSKAVDDLYAQMASQLDHTPYAVFGHSMGSLLAYELTIKIQEQKQPEPFTVFLSGRQAPHVKDAAKSIHDLPEEEFRQALRKLGGTSEDFFEEKQLYEMLAPVIRADFKLMDSYKLKNKVKVNSPLIVFTGTEDDTIQGNIRELEQYSNCGCKIIEMEGGHFFLHEHEEQLLHTIQHRMLEYRRIVGAAY